VWERCAARSVILYARRFHHSCQRHREAHLQSWTGVVNDDSLPFLEAFCCFGPDDKITGDKSKLFSKMKFLMNMIYRLFDPHDHDVLPERLEISSRHKK
jgi:hypothetical protein